MDQKQTYHNVATKHKVSQVLVRDLTSEFLEQLFKYLEKNEAVKVVGLGKYRIKKVVKKIQKPKKKKDKKLLQEFLLSQEKEIMFMSGEFAKIQRRRKQEAWERQREFLESFSTPIIFDDGIGAKKHYISPHQRAKDYVIERDYFIEQKQKENEPKPSNKEDLQDWEF